MARNKYNTEIEIVKRDKANLLGSIVFLLIGIILLEIFYFTINLFARDIIAFFIMFGLIFICFVLGFNFFVEWYEKKEIYKIPARKVR